MIKDLKEGDEYSGKLNEPEYTVDGDSITFAMVHMDAQTLSVKQLTDEKMKLTKIIADAQLSLAEVNKRLDLIAKDNE